MDGVGDENTIVIIICEFLHDGQCQFRNYSLLLL